MGIVSSVILGKILFFFLSVMDCLIVGSHLVTAIYFSLSCPHPVSSDLEKNPINNYSIQTPYPAKEFQRRGFGSLPLLVISFFKIVPTLHVSRFDTSSGKWGARCVVNRCIEVNSFNF